MVDEIINNSDILEKVKQQYIDEDKLLIARWIVRCNEITEELEHLLDKAYPDGAEDRFYDDWEDVLEHINADKKGR